MFRICVLTLPLLLLLCCPSTLRAQGLDIESRYSPLNRRRSPRGSTEYIILHTTEGGGRGSLEKLRRFGEAHYMVDTDGKVYRIIERHRIATHAGRSMWNGRTNLDNFSIGIEVVGYHDKPMTSAQIRALRELLRQLKAIYSIPDNRILPHSMVAYGSPNRWHRANHRGRKRCGMLMAREDIRAQIGLHDKPRADPDVRAGRLVVADEFLERVLFGPSAPGPGAAAASAAPAAPADPNVIARNRSAWDIAREQYNAPTTFYEFPDGRVLRGNEISNWNTMPPGTVVRIGSSATLEQQSESERVITIGTDTRSAREFAGDAALDEKTIYFLPTGEVIRGNELTPAQLDSLVDGTGMLVGYVSGGRISARRRAFDIVGPRWNLATTFYRFPDGTVRTGDQINERNIPLQTEVFFQP
ncbi:MAG: N-acetylmuramoyl-L-alanine amidase [Verrucomicrobia bacterium]|nr:N-acetylmuramoyl-L-alanine amidase [Verrucomicrobiota bacterium]